MGGGPELKDERLGYALLRVVFTNLPATSLPPSSSWICIGTLNSFDSIQFSFYLPV